MALDEHRERIVEQFSERGTRSDIWRVFDRVLDTDAYLNLGYTNRFRPHGLGSSQHRLGVVVGNRLREYHPMRPGDLVLDLGCGRGGPAIHFAEEYGYNVIGIDLVPDNVDLARANALERGVNASFVIGDATRLAVKPESVTACVSIDALVYVPNRQAALEEIAAVLEPGGIFVCTDLVARTGTTPAERRALSRFADAWDVAPLWTPSEYVAALEDAGFDCRDVEDISSGSVRRFRKWTTLYGWLAGTPVRQLIDLLVAHFGADPTRVTKRIHRAHDALPALQHIAIVARW